MLDTHGSAGLARTLELWKSRAERLEADLARTREREMDARFRINSLRVLATTLAPTNPALSELILCVLDQKRGR